MLTPRWPSPFREDEMPRKTKPRKLTELIKVYETFGTHDLQVVEAPHPSYDSRVVEVVRCDDCGEVLEEGFWPFCFSRVNPEGHSKGVYGFKTKMSMKLNGWNRSKV